MIDTHSHIYLEQFDQDREVVIERAVNTGVSKIILPNIDMDSFERLLKTSTDYPDICIPLNGLHPTSVTKNYEAELDFILNEFNNHSFAGVGEIGIDLYWDKTHLKEQKVVFETQVDYAIQNKLPIVIHARDSFEEIFDSLRKFESKHLIGVFHSFSGKKSDVETIKKLGNFYFGINGIVTFKNSELKNVLANIGLNRILLETDAPYLAPAPHRGKRNESSYIYNICKFISQEMQLDFSEVDLITSNNANELFNIN